MLNEKQTYRFQYFIQVMNNRLITIKYANIPVIKYYRNFNASINQLSYYCFDFGNYLFQTISSHQLCSKYRYHNNINTNNLAESCLPQPASLFTIYF